MKSTKILVAYILTSCLLLSNLTIIPAYATENTTLNNTTNDYKTTRNNQIIYLNSLKVDKKEVKPNDNVTVSLKTFEFNPDCKITVHYRSERTGKLHSVNLNFNSETGLYEGYFETNQFTVPGEWYISGVNARDNTTYSTSNPPYSDYKKSDVTFNVINTTLENGFLILFFL